MVVGGGLSGLTAADALARSGVTVTIVEARPFIGGRTMSVTLDELGERAWFDTGATWHWEDQPRVRALAEELGMEVFPQFRTGQALSDEDPEAEPSRIDVPPPSPAELRFVGGAQGFCQRLADRLAAGNEILLDTTVVAIDQTDRGVTVSAVGPDNENLDLRADAVVLAVPPRLVIDNIPITPDLPEEVEEVVRRTPTWMATALKCVAVYEEPFWRDMGLSGLAFCPGEGPLREVHDACNDDGSVAALWGFVSPRHEYRDLDFDDRRERVFAHLGRLFGTVAADPLRYFERDWSGDPFTNDEVFVPHDLLDYGNPAFASPLLDGRLVWAGTETAAEGGGHMEGAIVSGLRAAETLLEGRR